jgi:CRISPR-associated protein (TIGR03986 family)
MSKYKYSTTEKFVNPYNFVPLEETCDKSIDYKKRRKEGNLTGWIVCTLETLSPVFIPNTSSVYEDKKGNKHSDVFHKRVKENGEEKIINSYEFFSHEDLSKLGERKKHEPPEPVIPGSEIRGVIRSAFEAVTNSCLSTIDDGQLLYKRVTFPAYPGKLIFDSKTKKWRICEYKRARLPENWISIKNNDIYVKGIKYDSGNFYIIKNNKGKVIKVSSRKGSNFIKGELVIGEPFQKKNNESVFHSPSPGSEFEISPKAVENLLENIKMYKDETINIHKKSLQPKLKKKHSGYKNIKAKTCRDLDGIFIYYFPHNNEYYLSPAAIGREVFYNKLTEIVKDHKPCQTINRLCPACALFGIAGRNDSVASRVRFTDALVTKKMENPKDYYHNVRILKELASPKLSATEFYLKREPEDADIWNYDYAVKWKSQRDGIRGYKPQIRGRKFYWHHKNTNKYYLEDEKLATERNVAVRALKVDDNGKGTTFEFKVYFNKITRKELKQLLWVLEIGGDKSKAHKIGMGKPLGMGSVQINVLEIKFRKIAIEDETIKYNLTDDESILNEVRNNFNPGCEPKILEQFKEISDFENTHKDIHYPQNEFTPEEKQKDKDVDATFNWFVANKQIDIEHGGKGGKGTRPIIEKTLPPIQSPWLLKYKKCEDKGRKRR